MPVIGKALGYKSQAATAIYARLTNDPVRLAMEAAQKFLFEDGDLDKGGGNVVPITEGEKAKKIKTAKKRKTKKPK